MNISQPTAYGVFTIACFISLRFSFGIYIYIPVYTYINIVRYTNYTIITILYMELSSESCIAENSFSFFKFPLGNLKS